MDAFWPKEKDVWLRGNHVWLRGHDAPCREREKNGSVEKEKSVDSTERNVYQTLFFADSMRDIDGRSRASDVFSVSIRFRERAFCGRRGNDDPYYVLPFCLTLQRNLPWSIEAMS